MTLQQNKIIHMLLVTAEGSESLVVGISFKVVFTYGTSCGPKKIIF